MIKPLRRPTNAEEHAYMAMRQEQNRARTVRNVNENWMAEKLDSTGLKWTRQAQWGYRLFDFWNALYGLAIEVDGPEHNCKYDQYRDTYNYRRSGIIVLRVKNMDEDDAAKAIAAISVAETWKDRRIRMQIECAPIQKPEQPQLL